MPSRLLTIFSSFLLIVSSIFPRVGRAQTLPDLTTVSVPELNQRLDTKRKDVRELQDKVDAYNARIRQARSEAVTLANQISVVDSSIEKTELNVKAKELEIDQLQLEMELIVKEVEQEEERIADTRTKMADVLGLIHRYDGRSSLDMVVASSSFSQLYDQIHYSKVLGARLQDRINVLKSIRENLNGNRALLESKKKDADGAKEALNAVQDSLEEERVAKENLLMDTKSSEAQFQKLLGELRKQQSSIDSEIITLEKTVRDKIAAEKLLQGNGKLSWPVSRSRGISAYFHDPDYPFRYVFEHPAIDIRATQGSSVVAAGPGYVARAKDAGMGYSYVMVVHGDGISTVYGHVSQIFVQEGTYVTAGQVIAASGGRPGTPGAGPLTTGAHLHFEVRLNGVPVDPLKYLP